MGEEKINNQNLIDILVSKRGVDKETAANLIDNFVLLIEKGLKKDGIVKIRELGTFKLVDVKSRESIDVNTGERIEIQGHTKVSFTPEATLRDLINKPFSLFETTILNEGVSFNDEPKSTQEYPEEVSKLAKEEEIIKEETIEETEKIIEETVEPELPPLLTTVTSVVKEPIEEKEQIEKQERIDVLEEKSIEEPIEEVKELTKIEESVEEEQIEDEKTIEDSVDIEEPIEKVEEEIIEKPVEKKVQVEVEEEKVEEPTEDKDEPEKLSLEEIIARELLAANRMFHKSIDGNTPDEMKSILKKDREKEKEKKKEMLLKDTQKKQLGKEELAKEESLVSESDNATIEDTPIVPRRPNKAFMITTIIIAIIICTFSVLFTYFPDFMDKKVGYRKDKSQESETVMPAYENPEPAPKVVIDSVEVALTDATDVDTQEIVPNEVEEELPKEEEVVPIIKEEPKSVTPPKVVVDNPATTQSPSSNRIYSNDSPVRTDSTSYKIVGTKTTHTVLSGETLTRISLRFYGTKDLWPYLLMHNSDVITDPQQVSVGMSIRIPELEKK